MTNEEVLLELKKLAAELNGSIARAESRIAEDKPINIEVLAEAVKTLSAMGPGVMDW